MSLRGVIVIYIAFVCFDVDIVDVLQILFLDFHLSHGLRDEDRLERESAREQM